MKKGLGLVAVLSALFIINGCGGGSGSSDKYLNITESNAKELSKNAIETVVVLPATEKIGDELEDIIKSLLSSKRAIAGSSQELTYNCDEGNIKLTYKDENNQKSATLVANKCLDDGDYYNGKVEFSKKVKNDANKTKEESAEFNKFTYKSEGDTVYWDHGIIYNKTIEYSETGNEEDMIDLQVKAEVSITGYVKDDEDKVSFDNFKATNELKSDKYNYYTINGKVMFSDYKKWIEIKTLKDVKSRHNSNNCPVSGEVKVIGKNSYVKVEFKNNGNVAMYYNGKTKICEENCKDCFKD